MTETPTPYTKEELEEIQVLSDVSAQIAPGFVVPIPGVNTARLLATIAERDARIAELEKEREWQDMETLPRGETVQIAVRRRPGTKYGDNPPGTYPAYVDEHGNLCSAGSWEPEPGFNNEWFVTTHWAPLKSPPTPPEKESM